MQSLGVTWSDEDAKHCLGGPLERVDAYMRSRAKGDHKPLELAFLLIDRMIERLSSGVSFTLGAENLLLAMHDEQLPMALVSASTRKIMDAALQSIGDKFFSFTCSADDVAAAKPDPEGYLKAADALGVDIERTLIIEDSITGMRAAIDSGGYVLGLPHLTPLPEGEKVVHRQSLEALDLQSLAELFNTKMAS
jgi:beta-phosphoglucomutase-like phosphatase (HAD superfamily)